MQKEHPTIAWLSTKKRRFKQVVEHIGTVAYRVAFNKKELGFVTWKCIWHIKW